jgi:hypothetical protein
VRSWLDRRVQRQNDLERGVDADLIRALRRKWIWVAWLFGSCGLLIGVDRLFQLRGWFQKGLVSIAVLFFVMGAIIAKWAAAENAFLNRPEPEERPKLVKF